MIILLYVCQLPIPSGMYSKSGGSAQMNGYDVQTDMDTIRKSLGICPQHNMLFPELSVMEHFTLFGMVMSIKIDLKYYVFISKCFRTNWLHLFYNIPDKRFI